MNIKINNWDNLLDIKIIQLITYLSKLKSIKNYWIND